ncbi:MAG: hypothetical protein SVZ03_01340 [Spirochaetota bacterium]|nr:hypothetical protein [Spirochaetota bacterium]
MRFSKYLLYNLFVLTILTASLSASTDLTIDLIDDIEFVNKEMTESSFEQFPTLFFSENDEVIPTAFAMVNTLGYPMGKSTICLFPHFEFGIAAGGGLLEYSRKDDYTDEKPSVPFGGVNCGFHWGTGITDRLDITFKLFFFSLEWVSSIDQTFQGEGVTTSYEIKLDESDVTSLGVKGRYRLIRDRLYIPMVYTFGGITLNLSIDYMKGEVGTTFSLSDTQSVDLNYQTMPISANISSNICGEGTIDWNILTITPEIFAYIDLFHVFSLYTGPSVSFNFGSFDFNIDATGDFIVLIDPISGDIGNVTLRSRNHMTPRLIIPKWTVGFEIDLLLAKLQIEGATLLTSVTDSFTAQVGIRFQL